MAQLVCAALIPQFRSLAPHPLPRRHPPPHLPLLCPLLLLHLPLLSFRVLHLPLHLLSHLLRFLLVLLALLLLLLLDPLPSLLLLLLSGFLHHRLLFLLLCHPLLCLIFVLIVTGGNGLARQSVKSKKWSVRQQAARCRRRERRGRGRRGSELARLSVKERRGSASQHTLEALPPVLPVDSFPQLCARYQEECADNVLRQRAVALMKTVAMGTMKQQPKQQKQQQEQNRFKVHLMMRMRTRRTRRRIICFFSNVFCLCSIRRKKFEFRGNKSSSKNSERNRSRIDPR